MTPEQFSEIIERVGASGSPHVELIKRAESRGPRVGVFASSFNPPTVAHIELMGRAAANFSLDEVLALAGKANADKTSYESPLEDRLRMLALALADDGRASIGLSSHAFYVDMLDALRQVYPGGTDLHFITGFDTFVRVLDRGDKYTSRYHRPFVDRTDALKYVLSHSHLVVAARAGAGYGELRALVESEAALYGNRILYLDFPEELAERSATEVRERARAGQSIAGLVPQAVEQYIRERELYK